MKTKKVAISTAIFEEAGSPYVSTATRNRILKRLEKVHKPKSNLSLPTDTVQIE